VENHAVVVTIEEEEDKEGVSLAITQLKAKMAQTPEEAPSQTKTNPPTPPPPTNTIQLDIPDSKRTPTFHYESKAVTPDAAKCIYEVILNMPISHLMISNLLSISPDLHKEAIEHSRTHKVPALSTTLSAPALVEDHSSSPPVQIEHAMPLQELHVTLNGVHSELGLLDEGSEIVVIREDIWKKTQAPINTGMCMRMQTANRGSQDMARCSEMLEIDVEGIKTWAHAYVVPDTPY
jgi:hypothetical protein